MTLGIRHSAKCTASDETLSCMGLRPPELGAWVPRLCGAPGSVCVAS